MQVLFAGGDDIVIACRGDLALPLATELVLAVSGATDWGWSKCKKVGLSAGVVVTRVGFPFRAAHAIAEGLLREAKQTAMEEGWSRDDQERHGAVDYAVVSESSADLEVILAQRFVGTKDRPRAIAFSGRPYRAAASGRRSIGGLMNACRRLAQDDFPRSRLFELRRELTREALDINPGAPLSPSEQAEARARLQRLDLGLDRADLPEPRIAGCLDRGAAAARGRARGVVRVPRRRGDDRPRHRPLPDDRSSDTTRRPRRCDDVVGGLAVTFRARVVLDIVSDFHPGTGAGRGARSTRWSSGTRRASPICPRHR